MTTRLRFRNVTASPDDPVETWPFEGILAAVERGTLPDWRRLAGAVQADPWGAVARQVLEAVRLSRPYGTTELLEGVVARARQDAADAERAEVAAEIRDLVRRSSLTQQEFAERIGTSRSRLSTYMSGKITPSAAFMIRMRRVPQERLRRYPAALLVPWQLTLGGARLPLFTTLTTLAAPRDVTLAELAVELFYPADDPTAAILRDGQDR